MLIVLADDLAVESSAILGIRFDRASGDVIVRLRKGDGTGWTVHGMTESEYATLVSKVIAAQKEEYRLENCG